MKLPRYTPSAAAAARDCVLFPGALGDFICLLPALQQLAQNGAIDLFARSEFRDLVAAPIHVRSSERPEVTALFVDGAVAQRGLESFFAAYRNVYSWMGSQVEVFARQLRQVAPRGAQLFPFRPIDSQQHQSEYYLQCIGCSGPAQGSEPVIPLAPLAQAWCNGLFAKHELRGRPVLVIAPGSGALEKNWPVAGFLQVARWWQGVNNGIVLTLLGPVEAERGGFEALAGETLTLGDLSLAQCAALLSRCQLYLGNDSGITHLAAAVGAPTVALFGPSNPAQWAPRGPRVNVISLHAECAPCATPAMKSCPHRQCLTGLGSDSVIRQLEGMLMLVTPPTH